MSTLFDPDKIEHELTLLQRSLSPSETRAMLFNLLIFSRKEDETEVERALGYLLGKRPARVIHIRTSDSAVSSIHVSARCFPDRENKGVCFQEIAIENGKDGTGGAVGSWSPLLLRDIPVYLWWMDRLLPVPEVLQRAREHVDKIIVNTQLEDKHGDALCRVYTGFVAETLKQDIPVSDMSWRRLASLRKVSAQLFDSAETRPMLSEIQHVQIRGADEISAQLYIAWLANRLRWNRTERDAFSDGEGKTVTWKHSQPSALEQGVSITFVLDTWDEVRVRTDPSGFAELTARGAKPSIVSAAVPGYGEILLEELDYLYHDYLFAEVAGNIRCTD